MWPNRSICHIVQRLFANVDIVPNQSGVRQLKKPSVKGNNYETRTNVVIKSKLDSKIKDCIHQEKDDTLLRYMR